RNTSLEKQSISTEQGLAAAKEISQIAQKESIGHALTGGIAMHLYGFTRATTDVDLVASALLSALQESKKLSFGGATYPVQLDNRVIDVDWIVRDDEKDFVYQTALAGAIETGEGIRIISPEWMVILKHFAGRGKDEMDLLWLLREPGLVDRK